MKPRISHRPNYSRSPTSVPEAADQPAAGSAATYMAHRGERQINTVGNIAANAYRKLGVHGAAAAVTSIATCTRGADPESTSGPSASASRRAARYRERHHPRGTANASLTPASQHA